MNINIAELLQNLVVGGVSLFVGIVSTSFANKGIISQLKAKNRTLELKANGTKTEHLLKNAEINTLKDTIVELKQQNASLETRLNCYKTANSNVALESTTYLGKTLEIDLSGITAATTNKKVVE